ncbi:MAG: AMP-binding protein, partial [Psychrosphaera sp.]|nr:AMP-binding protein [Psychrosphaera sp.]
GVDGIESSVGLYINTLPLACQWSDKTTVKEQLGYIQQQIAALNSYTGISLADLQSNGKRLFHSLFVFENFPLNDAIALGDAITLGDSIQGPVDESMPNVTLRKVVEKADYPLSVIAFEQANTVVIRLHYDKLWLDESHAQRLLAQLQQILLSISTEPNQYHQAISLLNEQQRDELAHRWDVQANTYQRVTLQQQFETQVQRTPDAIALVFGQQDQQQQQHSYRQLNEKANQLAHLLRIKGVKANTLVALYLTRSSEMIVAILAVLKAGGAYVPISPQYPRARTEFMLGDSQSGVVITQQEYAQSLSEMTDKALSPLLLCIDDEALSAHMPRFNPEPVNTPADLAYVIYTSGTTGKPKGVMINHHNVMHLTDAQYQCFDLAQCKRALLFSAYVFDASVFELFVTLFNGMTAYLCTEDDRQNARAIGQLIARERIDFATLPPVMLSQFNLNSLNSLKSLVSAGE